MSKIFKVEDRVVLVSNGKHIPGIIDCKIGKKYYIQIGYNWYCEVSIKEIYKPKIPKYLNKNN